MSTEVPDRMPRVLNVAVHPAPGTAAADSDPFTATVEVPVARVPITQLVEGTVPTPAAMPPSMDTAALPDDPAVLNNPELHAVPDSELTRWNVPGMVARAGWTEADYQAFRAARPVQDLFLREFRAAGGMIAAGTDAANQLLVPGASEQREMELLVDAGLTPSDALAAATRNGAVLLGADSLGVLAPGKAADLVVLGGDPLVDIHNIQKVERVMVRGFIVSADSLRAAW